MAGATKQDSHETFESPRRSPRRIPAKSVTVAVLDCGFPSTYGVVTNISESGACVQTGKVSTERSIHMMLSFANGEMLEASGHAVWSQPLEADGTQALYGIEFTELSEGKREMLRTMLDSPAFTAADR